MTEVRFGLLLGGLRVLIPRDVRPEVLANSDLYRFPRAPRGVAGLVQVRGMPIPVLDPLPAEQASSVERQLVLLAPTDGDLGGAAAVCADAMPAQVVVSTTADPRPKGTNPGEVGMLLSADLIGGRRLGGLRQEGRPVVAEDQSVWWDVEFNTLLRHLAS